MFLNVLPASCRQCSASALHHDLEADRTFPQPAGCRPHVGREVRWLAVFLTFALAFSSTEFSQAAETNSPPNRIGIYDSRVIAYAHFWSDAHQQKIKDLAKSAKEAKAAGDMVRFRDMEAELKNEQDQSHLRVFSTAPIDSILALMQNRVDEVQRTTRVGRLVSKWDAVTLKQFQHAEQFDVTDALLRDFRLNEKQMKVITDIRKQKPLPLEKARELLREGKL